MRYLIIGVVIIVTVVLGLSVLRTGIRTVTKCYEKQAEIMELLK